MADMRSEELDGEGTFAILTATPNATNQNAWIEALEQVLEEDDYADLELGDTVYGNDDDLESFQEMQGLMQSYPDLDGGVAPTTGGRAAGGRDGRDTGDKGEGGGTRPGALRERGSGRKDRAVATTP